jgi:hypothetical protein
MSRTLEREIRNLAARIQMDERDGSPSLDDLERLPALLERWVDHPPVPRISFGEDTFPVHPCGVVCALH